MNLFILRLFEEFNRRDVKYCHFKSNNNLIPAVNGVDDLDLLVGPGCVDTFNEILSSFGYRMAHDRGKEPTPYVYHYFASDPDTGLLVHLHVYFKIVTGGSVFKNNWIRIEKMFLANRILDEQTKLFIPCAEADCILFVIRKLIEQPSPVEHFLFYRDWKNIKGELDWLMERADRNVMSEMVSIWLPELSTQLFEDSLDSLVNTTPILARVKLGIKMRAVFSNTVRGSLYSEVSRGFEFLGAYLKGKLKVRRKNRFLLPGGLLIAFIGSEAIGKSTLSKGAASWLEERFDVSQIHLGKPKKNWRTGIFWYAIKCYSVVKKVIAPTKVSSQNLEPAIGLNLPHPLVSWLDSIDRKHYMDKYFRKLMQGGTVITDRYPSEHMDGSRIIGNSKFTKFLAKLERKNYLSMPNPDLVIKVMAPLDLTLERNSLRSNPEPEVFVRARYELAMKVDFPYSEMALIRTDQDYSSSLGEVRRTIWKRSSVK